MESNHEQFRRIIDGVIGVGFVQLHTGIPVAAIAWPDREPVRYVMSDLAGYAIEHVLEESHFAEPDPSSETQGQESNGTEGEDSSPESPVETQSESHEIQSVTDVPTGGPPVDQQTVAEPAIAPVVNQQQEVSVADPVAEPVAEVATPDLTIQATE